MTEPWETEPNKKTFEHAGLPCLILRQKTLLCLWGYVGLPVGHPLHGKDAHAREAGDIDVHGGLTHSWPMAEDIDRWWLGFDCGHDGDIIPGDADMAAHYATYWTIEDVERETRRLADQLAAMKTEVAE